jgi:hypothetical protein
MDRIKPFEKIAAHFQISRESAKYFLGRVQKSFKTERPSHQLILEFMDAQKMEFLPAPYEIAVMLHESGVWSHALNAAPAGPVDDDDFG